MAICKQCGPTKRWWTSFESSYREGRGKIHRRWRMPGGQRKRWLARSTASRRTRCSLALVVLKAPVAYRAPWQRDICCLTAATRRLRVRHPVAVTARRLRGPAPPTPTERLSDVINEAPIANRKLAAHFAGGASRRAELFGAGKVLLLRLSPPPSPPNPCV